MKENFIVEQTLKPSWYGTAFEVKIKSAGYVAKQRGVREELQQLKARLLRPILEATRDPELGHRLRLAANEAMAVAWMKRHPFLLFPYLVEQKVNEVQQWFQRQKQILTAVRSFAQ